MNQLNEYKLERAGMIKPLNAKLEPTAKAMRALGFQPLEKLYRPCSDSVNSEGTSY